MTIFPNTLQVDAVFTTTRPVTHVAEVDVNNAVNNGTETLLFVEIGSLSKAVPIMMIAKKPNTKLLAGLKVFRETIDRLCFGIILSGITILSGFSRMDLIPFAA